MRILKTIGSTLGLLGLLASPAQAQDEVREPVDFPETEIFLFDIDLGAAVTIANGRNVTNRPGYDNQPSFTPDSSRFLFSRSDAYQIDVYEYDIASGTARQVTETATNEFSPVASPDNATISFVTDGPGARQNIATIARSSPATQSMLLPGEALREPVGYYAWDHDNGNVLFWSRYGFNVTLANRDTQSSRYVSGDAVPSTPYIIPGTRRFSFVHRQGDTAVWIKELDPETMAVRPIVAIAGSNANYGWAPDGSILMIQDDRLYRFTEADADAGWQEIADLSDYGIASANRLAVSPDGTKLAIVGTVAE